MTTLSIVIPCYNEEYTLANCVAKVMEIADAGLALQIIIVDDYSQDRSYAIAQKLAARHPQIQVIRHSKNQGKGAALRSGFALTNGDFVAVQDADLEYDPKDLKKLLEPLLQDKADVVLGSRFLTNEAHRVLFFWHSLGNRFLTLLSNMFTDLNLTDMETCYKVFRREVIKNIAIEENRFGFEPEIVAKIANMRLRVYEMGISYSGRTYEEGKKIRFKDGLRALYCIFRYNAHRASLPIQFFFYLFIGGTAALVNILSFLVFFYLGIMPVIAAAGAFLLGAVVNYFLCIWLMFRHTIKWNTPLEVLIYFAVVVSVGILDTVITTLLLSWGAVPGIAKASACAIALLFNFLGRRFFVFPERTSGPWKPQCAPASNENEDQA